MATKGGNINMPEVIWLKDRYINPTGLVQAINNIKKLKGLDTDAACRYLWDEAFPGFTPLRVVNRTCPQKMVGLYSYFSKCDKGNPVSMSVSRKKSKSNVENKGLVYFIRAGNSLNIKIGYTTVGLKKRLKSLQTGNAKKLHMVCSLKGGHRLEKQLHKKFKEDRLCGEWFNLSPKLQTFIEEAHNGN